MIARPQEALELLEEARPVFWAQALQLRSPLKDLPQNNAHQLKIMFRLFEDGDKPEKGDSSDLRTWADPMVSLQRRKGRDAEKLIAIIQLKPGFDRFLLSQPFSVLAKAASKGPIVVLLAHELMCEALILPDPTSAVTRWRRLACASREKTVE